MYGITKLIKSYLYNGTHTRPALQKGIEAHKAGRFKEADQHYTAILQSNSKHPDANHNMGVLAVGIGKIEQALPFFRIALEANPSIEQFWLSYIDALLKLDRIDAAKEVFARAKSSVANGDIFDRVEKRFNLLNTKNSNMERPSQKQIETLIELYSQGQHQQLFNQASHLLTQFPKSSDLLNILGAANQNLGKLNEAIEAYAEAISLKPDYADAHNNMGNALEAQGKLDEAIEAYYEALSLEPAHADAYHNVANALKAQGKVDEAIEAYGKAISIKPDFASAYYNMGIILGAKGKVDEAIKAYSKAISIKPDFANAYYNMGNSLTNQGKLSEAINAYSKALSIKPDYECAKHMLSALTGNKAETAPKKFIENLFNEYSKKFETSLVDNLKYKVPELIKNILIKPNSNGSLGAVLDLGCGTGLLGLEIKKYCSLLEGIDLSSKMLDLAKEKDVYDKLSRLDIMEYLSSKPLNFDYYIALDVFIYVGDLTEVFRLIKTRSRQPAYLVFSTEHTETDGYHLLRSGRFSHSKSYIESLCKKFSYKISQFSTTKLRKEQSSFLTGGIYILEFDNEI